MTDDLKKLVGSRNNRPVIDHQWEGDSDGVEAVTGGEQLPFH